MDQKVIRSESETTVHCCVWQLAISQKACRIIWSSRFDRKGAADPLVWKTVAPFCLALSAILYKGGKQVISDEKKAWAEEVLRRKKEELGRLPTKKDFDDVTCSQIKAFLGPWPRALEAAGLKQPKEKKSQ